MRCVSMKGDIPDMTYKVQNNPKKENCLHDSYKRVTALLLFFQSLVPNAFVGQAFQLNPLSAISFRDGQLMVQGLLHFRHCQQAIFERKCSYEQNHTVKLSTNNVGSSQTTVKFPILPPHQHIHSAR